MGTHATLGIKYPDGTISGCYVHYDGHTMETRIKDFVKNFTTTSLAVLIAKAQSAGGIRSFHCGSMETGKAETELLDDGGLYVIDESNWSGDHMGAQFQYLVDYDSGEVNTFIKKQATGDFVRWEDEDDESW